jgi:predicted AlkP superfamily pyrophosphatase or phosphodiesterase
MHTRPLRTAAPRDGSYFRSLRSFVSFKNLGLLLVLCGVAACCAVNTVAQTAKVAAGKIPQRPKLVVLLVVDQMRGDYVDKFRGQWSGGLKRLVDQGAWFRAAAYPYAATETCVGHSTISTGAFPATHGMIANGWWDRETQKTVTCTSDPKAKNTGYAGAVVKGGDSGWRMQVPSFAEELKFQTGDATRVVTFSLKARAAITMAGHKADAATWVDGGGLATSSIYGTLPFIEDYAKSHPIRADDGKSWTLSLPESAYRYDKEAVGAAPPEGWKLSFPHVLRADAKRDASAPDDTFYEQWAGSPFADTYLTRIAEAAVDSLGLGKGGGIDFLGVSYSSVDYVGHGFGPRSREIQDILIRLDKDLGELFAHLDQKIGRGNYVVALSADHGVAPVVADIARTGVDAGLLRVPELQQRIEKALEPFNYPKPAISRISSGEIYFAPGMVERLNSDGAALRAISEAALSQPGVAGIYWAAEIDGRPATQSAIRTALSDSYYAGRSGDLLVVGKPYWQMDNSPAGKARDAGYGTGHGTPYYYDQHVPILLMGYGIQSGEYYREVTPADIAPTLAALTGITLAPRDGHVLFEALSRSTGATSRKAP